MGLLDRLLGRQPTPEPRQRRPTSERRPTPRTGAQIVGERGEQHESWYVPGGRDPSRFASAGEPPRLRLIEYRDSRGELVLRLCEDETGLLVGPTDNRLPKVGVFVSQLRGEAYHQAACRAGNFSPGAPVVLRREPENPHDSKAVAVYDATGKHKAAYVNKQQAARLSKLIDAEAPIEAVSIRGTAAGVACEQVAVLAADPDVLEHLMSERPAYLPKPAHLR